MNFMKMYLYKIDLNSKLLESIPFKNVMDDKVEPM